MGAEKTNATGGYPVASPNRPGGPAFDSAGIIAENDLARKALRAMLDGKFTPNGAMSNYGGWADFVRVAQDAYTARGAAGVRAVVNVNPEALRLLSGDEPADGVLALGDAVVGDGSALDSGGHEGLSEAIS